MAENFYVYFLASKRNGTLYVGVTNDLVGRVFEHKQGAVRGFTKTHHVHMLVYFEMFADPTSAIQREKTITGWSRQWKINKLEESNPKNLIQRGVTFTRRSRAVSSYSVTLGPRNKSGDDVSMWSSDSTQQKTPKFPSGFFGSL